jgi:hypothetical protein
LRGTGAGTLYPDSCAAAMRATLTTPGNRHWRVPHMTRSGPSHEGQQCHRRSAQSVV